MLYCTVHAGLAGRSSSAVRNTLSWMSAAVFASVLRPMSWPRVVRKSMPYLDLRLLRVPRSFSKKNLSPSRSAWNCFVQIARLVSRSEEHTSELQSRGHLVCRLLLEKKKKHPTRIYLLKNKTKK